MDTPILTIDKQATVSERLTDNAEQNILPARYLRKDKEGNVIEGVEELFERVAHNVAQAETKFESNADLNAIESKFETAMKELRFMPNSPTLMNAGTPMNQLSACFVLEPKDSMLDIKETDKEAAMIFKSGGGVGYAFHHLRPKGSYISTTGGYSSGPVSFMKMFNETCQQVQQGGKRRGAQMAIMRVDHPDVGRFIVAKRNEGSLDNFNISVGVTDEFIEAVEAGEDYQFYDPNDDFDTVFNAIEESEHFYNPEYQENPASAFDDGEGETVDENLWRDYADEIEVEQDGETVSLREKWEDRIHVDESESLTLPARFIWDMMIDGAHRNGEPGIFHYDEANDDNSFPRGETEYDIEATNPCAEQPLTEHEACNLGHVNLSLMVEEDAETWDEWEKSNPLNTDTWSIEQSVEWYLEDALDLELLAETVQTGTRFLDNVATQSDFPLDDIENTVDSLRKIGLGIMGLAQMLYQMGVPYDSEIGREVASQVIERVDAVATHQSHMLALERGTFDAWDESKYAEPTEHEEWFRLHVGDDPEIHRHGYPMRNHKVTTIAPTGTTSMIGDTSGGCEPVYSVAFYKNVGGDIQGDDFLVEFDSYFLETLRENGIDVEEVKAEAERQMEAEEWDGVAGLDALPDEFGDVFVTTEQIAAEDHTRMQRRLQEHIDSGISKTINLPADATRGDVDDAYSMALSESEPGAVIKGVTVYRDKSRDEQVKSTSKQMQESGLDVEGLETRLVDLYQADELSDGAVTELVNEYDLELEDGIDGELCPDCQESVMQIQEGCGLCPECGFSPCA